MGLGYPCLAALQSEVGGCLPDGFVLAEANSLLEQDRCRSAVLLGYGMDVLGEPLCVGLPGVDHVVTLHPACSGSLSGGPSAGRLRVQCCGLLV